ncbi:MAG TPA: hypothetical protein PKU71_15890, partial [bacterium]|nr:hypothetical protein [bacterium]
MTGEITLRGTVLPIGGVKEKILAAHRAGLRTIILPDKNEKDLDEVPAQIRKEMTFIPVNEVSKVIENALRPDKRAVHSSHGNGKIKPKKTLRKKIAYSK